MLGRRLQCRPAMTDNIFPKATPHLSKRRKALAPEAAEAFRNFSRAAFREGALSRKHKQIIAVAVAHVTQCPYCIRGHTEAATREGATAEELMEAIWIAVEMRAGAAFAHSLIAVDALDDKQPDDSQE